MSFTPSVPRAVAQLLPKPMLAAQTIAVRPRRPKSIFSSPDCAHPAGAQMPLLLSVALSIAWQSHASRLGSPHAEAGRFKTELPRPVRRFVLDFGHTDGIFEHHPVRPLEVEEARAGGRMAAGPENNRHPALAEIIKRPQHVVAGFDLMVDMLDAGLRRAHQCDGVVNRVDAHQGNIADAVADARVADLGPE